MDLSQRFYDFLKTENMIAPGERVLMALSGGKDSVCLAHLLVKFREKHSFSLAACHIHHGIRGEEADRD
ncbi:MAG: tRNA(Ile)-lysidine synthetase, partial [Clostridia bacterium]|nr:tRNA(Ile)-lysidine synthetase [Clostridia bacterium]